MNSDDVALGLGVFYAFQQVEEAINGIDVNELRTHLVLEHVDDLF